MYDKTKFHKGFIFSIEDPLANQRKTFFSAFFTSIVVLVKFEVVSTQAISIQCNNYSLISALKSVFAIAFKMRLE